MRISMLFLFCLFFTGTYAQGKKDNVLYLKDGSVIRGQVLDSSDQKIRILAADGSIWAVSSNELDSVGTAKRYRNYSYKSSGFAHFTELGPLVAGKTTVDGVTTAAFSFQTVNGYKINQFAMLGFGTGVDLYATQTIVPLFASFRGDFAKSGTVIPYYFIDAGYGANITQDSQAGEEFKGGLLYAAGLGLKIPFNRSAGFLLSLGYRYQATESIRNQAQIDTKYRRFAIRAGFFL